MANYYRQCPQCGGRTAATTCELCGKNTIITKTPIDEGGSKRTSEMPYGNYENKETPKDSHLQKMLKEGRNYQKEPLKRRNPIKIVIPFIIAFFVIAIPFFYDAIQEGMRQNDYQAFYDRVDEQYKYFKDYLILVKDDTPLTCSVDGDRSEWFYIENTTPYLFNADVDLQTLNGKESTSFYSGNPYATESSVASSPIQSCQVTDVEYRSLNIYETDIDFELVYDEEYAEMVILEQDVSEQDLELLLKRVYALHIVTLNTYDDTMKIMVNDQYAYQVEVDYEHASLFVTNIESQQKTEITLDII